MTTSLMGERLPEDPSGGICPMRLRDWACWFIAMSLTWHIVGPHQQSCY